MMEDTLTITSAVRAQPFNTCSTSVSKVCKIAFTIWVPMIDFIFFSHLHIRWSCSRSVWCWFHCSRLYLSSFSPPTKLVPLSHLSWTTLRRRFLNLLKHDMKSSMSIEWTNSKWTTRVSDTCKVAPAFHCTASNLDVQEAKNVHSGEAKGKAHKPSCYLSEGVLLVESLAWHEIFSDNISAENRANSLSDLIWSAARLAQWDKRRSAEREAVGSNPGRTNTQGEWMNVNVFISFPLNGF